MKWAGMTEERKGGEERVGKGREVISVPDFSPVPGLSTQFNFIVTCIYRQGS